MLSMLCNEYSQLIQSLKSIHKNLGDAIADIEQSERSVSVGDLIDHTVSLIHDIRQKLSDVPLTSLLQQNADSRQPNPQKKRKSKEPALSTASASSDSVFDKSSEQLIDSRQPNPQKEKKRKEAALSTASASASASSDSVFDKSSDQLIVPIEYHSEEPSGDFYQNYGGPAKLCNRYLIFY
jgi:hypothetical protein